MLVVGCGTGNEIERFVKASEHWTITGIDPSPEMIKQANDKLQIYDNVTLITGLVSDYSYVKAVIDVADEMLYVLRDDELQWMIGYQLP